MTPDARLRALRAHPHRDEIAEALERAAMRAALRGACRWSRELLRIADDVRR